MSDNDETIVVENLDTAAGGGGEETTTTETDPPAEGDKGKVVDEDPEALAAKKAQAEADAALAAEKKTATPGGEDEETEEEDPNKAAFKPDFKFKAAGKDHEVPDMYRSLMVDEKSAKDVKDLFSRAFASDQLIEKNKTLNDKFNTLNQENAGIKGGIDGLRQIYSSAVKHPSQGGNLLKMDQFFEKLQIPTEVILQYALAKVKFNELPPEQQNAITAQLDSEKKAQVLRQEQGNLQGQNMATIQRLRQLELAEYLRKPEIVSVANDFDKRLGKEGSFRDAVINQGEMAWLRQKIDLPVEEAVKKVMEKYDLKVSAEAPPATPAGGAGANGNGRKAVVQRTTQVIPNVQGKGSQSPLKEKPRSIEDLKKLAARAARGEAV